MPDVAVVKLCNFLCELNFSSHVFKKYIINIFLIGIRYHVYILDQRYSKSENRLLFIFYLSEIHNDMDIIQCHCNVLDRIIDYFHFHLMSTSLMQILQKDFLQRSS